MKMNLFYIAKVVENDILIFIPPPITKILTRPSVYQSINKSVGLSDLVLIFFLTQLLLNRSMDFCEFFVCIWTHYYQEIRILNPFEFSFFVIIILNIVMECLLVQLLFYYCMEFRKNFVGI